MQEVNRPGWLKDAVFTRRILECCDHMHRACMEGIQNLCANACTLILCVGGECCIWDARLHEIESYTCLVSHTRPNFPLPLPPHRQVAIRSWVYWWARLTYISPTASIPWPIVTLQAKGTLSTSSHPAYKGILPIVRWGSEVLWSQLHPGIGTFKTAQLPHKCQISQCGTSMLSRVTKCIESHIIILKLPAAVCACLCVLVGQSAELQEYTVTEEGNKDTQDFFPRHWGLHRVAS